MLVLPITFNDKINSHDLPPYSITNRKPIKANGQVKVILSPEPNSIGFNLIISDVGDLAPQTTFIYDFDTDAFTLEW